MMSEPEEDKIMDHAGRLAASLIHLLNKADGVPPVGVAFAMGIACKAILQIANSDQPLSDAELQPKLAELMKSFNIGLKQEVLTVRSNAFPDTALYGGRLPPKARG